MRSSRHVARKNVRQRINDSVVFCKCTALRACNEFGPDCRRDMQSQRGCVTSPKRAPA